VIHPIGGVLVSAKRKSVIKPLKHTHTHTHIRMNLKHILLCERASLERLRTVGFQPHEVLEKAKLWRQFFLFLGRKAPGALLNCLLAFLAATCSLSYIVWQKRKHPKDTN